MQWLDIAKSKQKRDDNAHLLVKGCECMFTCIEVTRCEGSRKGSEWNFARTIGQLMAIN